MAITFGKTKLFNGNSIKYFSFLNDFMIAAKWIAAHRKPNQKR